MNDPGRVRTAWKQLPTSIRLAIFLLLAGGLLNCVLNFTPSMRATDLTPPAEVRGLVRFGIALLWATLLMSLQPWAWVLVLAACLVPVTVTIYLLALQLQGAVPSFLRHVQYVGPVYLVTTGINLGVALLLLLPEAREAFTKAAESGRSSPPSRVP